LDEATHEESPAGTVPNDRLAWFAPGMIRVVEDAGQGIAVDRNRLLEWRDGVMAPILPQEVLLVKVSAYPLLKTL
jgi:hypothetical protein